MYNCRYFICFSYVERQYKRTSRNYITTPKHATKIMNTELCCLKAILQWPEFRALHGAGTEIANYDRCAWNYEKLRLKLEKRALGIRSGELVI
jgi:hypothetical protein